MRDYLGILIGVLVMVSATAYADIIAEIGAPAAPPASGYFAGDVIAIPLTLNAQGSRIAAVEIDVHCTTEVIQIGKGSEKVSGTYFRHQTRKHVRMIFPTPSAAPC